MIASDECDSNSRATGTTTDTPLVGPVALRIILLFGVVQIVLAALHIMVVWHDDGEWPGRLTRFVHLDREGNLPTWYASTQFLCLGAAFSILYMLDRSPPRSRRQWLWGICAVGAILLSIDEGAALHELLGTLAGLTFDHAPEGSLLSGLAEFPSYYWILIYVPVVLPVGVILLICVAKRIGRNRYLLFGGGLLYLSGALVLDFLEGRYGDADHTGLPIVLSGQLHLLDIFLIEEMLEMFGLTLALSAIAQHAASVSGRSDFSLLLARFRDVE